MKKLVSMTLVLTLLLIGSLMVSAEPIEGTKNSWQELTQEEIKVLKKDVGLSMDEIKERPADFLRSLIKEGAKKKFVTKKVVKVKDGKDSKDEISTAAYTDPQGDLEGDIQIEAEAYEVTSDISGAKKFRLVGRWKWISTPQNTFTDAFSIGVPDSGEFFLPEYNNHISQHMHDYYTSTINGYIRQDSGTNPDDFDPNSGVGYFIDLRQGFGSNHFGHMSQYIYTEKPSGTVTVKYEYGHERLSWSSIGFDKSGTFSIAASTGVDKGNVADTLEW